MEPCGQIIELFLDLSVEPRTSNNQIVYLQLFAAMVSLRLVLIMQYIINVWVAALDADGGRQSWLFVAELQELNCV